MHSIKDTDCNALKSTVPNLLSNLTLLRIRVTQPVLLTLRGWLRYRWVARGCREEASAKGGYAIGGFVCGQKCDAKLFCKLGVCMLTSLLILLLLKLHAHSQVYAAYR